MVKCLKQYEIFSVKQKQMTITVQLLTCQSNRHRKKIYKYIFRWWCVLNVELIYIAKRQIVKANASEWKKIYFSHVLCKLTIASGSEFQMNATIYDTIFYFIFYFFVFIVIRCAIIAKQIHPNKWGRLQMMHEHDKCLSI